MAEEPSLVRSLEDNVRRHETPPRVSAALTQRKRPAPPRTGVSGVAATGCDGIEADVRTATERAGGGHASSLRNGAPMSKGLASPRLLRHLNHCPYPHRLADALQRLLAAVLEPHARRRPRQPAHDV